MILLRFSRDALYSSKLRRLFYLPPSAEGIAEPGRHWFDCDRNAKALEALGQMVGASANEIVMGNSLTVNNTLMIQAFYMPNFTTGRYKILIMKHSFASDQAVVMSMHGHAVEKLELIGNS